MKKNGQSLVELAIVFPFLLFLLVGIVEFGMAFFQFVQLRDAAQEGGLYGSVCRCDGTEMEARVRAASSSPIDLTSPDVKVNISVFDPAGNSKILNDMCEGDALHLRVLYAHEIFMPFLPSFIGQDAIILNALVVDTVLVPGCI